MRKQRIGVDTSTPTIAQEAKQESFKAMGRDKTHDMFLNVYSILVSFIVVHSMYKTLLLEH